MLRKNILFYILEEIHIIARTHQRITHRIKARSSGSSSSVSPQKSVHRSQVLQYLQLYAFSVCDSDLKYPNATFFNLCEALQSLAGGESDSYAAEYALACVRQCQEKCFVKLLFEVVLQCCTTTEDETGVHHRFRQHRVKHIQHLLKTSHICECADFEELPVDQHRSIPWALGLRRTEDLCREEVAARGRRGEAAAF